MPRPKAHSPSVFSRVVTRYGTPHVVRKSQSTAGSSTLSKDRDFVFQDAGHSVPLVDIDSFCQHWLPKVPDLAEAEVVDIIEKSTQGPAYVNRRWTAFARDPINDCLHEEAVFEAFVPVVAAIRKAATTCVPDLVATTEFSIKPSDPPRSTVRRNNSRPDAYFVFKDPHRHPRAKKANWLDIVVTGEFKKGDLALEVEDNIKKVLWNMHHTNREDARRTRLFAFTIENRTMRLWYADHSTIAASDSFDFMDEPGPFIRFVIAFSYASQENLGFDPTITTDWDGRPRTKPQYIITVQSRTSPGVVKRYKTIKVLSALGAEAIRGRGTRVWTVREWADGDMRGEELALKDCWIDLNRDVEGEIMQRLTKAAKSARDKKELATMLLTVLIDGVVLLEDGSALRTVHGDIRDRLITENPRSYRIARLPTPCPSIGSSDDAPAQMAVGDYRDPSDAVETGTRPIVYPAKKRYRIGFAEICQPLHQVPLVEARICILSRACWALKLLHKLGWVHRDLSSSNIMVFNKVVKIADLEYAKKMDKKTVAQRHEIRTGTENYMAIEVVNQAFVFLPAEGADRRPAELAKRVLTREWVAPRNDAAFVEPSTDVNIAPWFYNPLHDMESIEWITIDTFTTRNPLFKYRKDSLGLKYKESVVQRWERIVKASNVAKHLFDGRSQRWALIASNSALKNTLLSILHPAIVSMAAKIAAMREFLVASYRKAEENPRKIDHRCADGVHDYFTTMLLEIADHIGAIGCDMRDQPLSDAARKMPERYRDMIYDWDSLIHITSKKRSREIEDDVHEEGEVEEDAPPSKSARTSVDQSPRGSPQPPPTSQSRVLEDLPVVVRSTRRRNVTVVPIPSRTLRSHVKREAHPEDVPSMTPAVRPAARRTRTLAARREDSRGSKAIRKTGTRKRGSK